MRPNLRTLSIALATAVLTSIAQAGPAAEVGVTGKIQPPHSACEVVLPHEVPYGVIPLQKINKERITLLDKKTIWIVISCGSPQRFGVRFIDAKHSTLPENQAFLTQVAKALPGATRESALGLGLDSADKKIGAMFLKRRSITYVVEASGISNMYRSTFIYRANDGWLENAGYLQKDTIHTAAASASAPHGGPPLMHDLLMSAELVPVLDSQHLDLKNKINVHGSLTVEVVQI